MTSKLLDNMLDADVLNEVNEVDNVIKERDAINSIKNG